MKSLKSAVLDWITPRGQPLNPPLARNIKSDRGFHHERTGALLCPASLNWSDVEHVNFPTVIRHLTSQLGPKLNSVVGSWLFPEISGRSSSTKGIVMTLKTRGMVCLGVLFLYQ